MSQKFVRTGPGGGIVEHIEIADDADISRMYRPAFVSGLVSVESWPAESKIWNGAKFVDPPAPSAEEKARAAFGRLVKSDEYMARMVEDLIGILLTKGTITEDDLDEVAKQKLTERQNNRLLAAQGGLVKIIRG